MLRPVLGLTALCILCAPASALQFGNAWLEFVRNDGTADLSATEISNPSVEVDFAWGDLDQNGWTDLVVARKQPFSTTGKRENQLLLNFDGVFLDLTRDFAIASDVPGDQGFVTPTNDRAVEVADVDNDGWLDVITATGREQFGDPKAVGHPRVYVNLGQGPGGEWLGLRYEEARFPQLLSDVSGLPMNPVFCGMAAGDVTGDGYVDLYFTHYDFSNNGFLQGPEQDLNDRLLINDGNGFFTDQSQLRMTPNMLFSRFGLSTRIADVNGDGFNDVIKDTALANPYFVSASYNDPANPGFFNIFDDFHDSHNPYHIDVGDLNNDGRLDLVAGDDAQDRYRYNLGNDVFGRVIWGPAKTFQFLAGGDDGFAGQNQIADLDNDGWRDVIIADIDTDEPGFNRRTNIYHNPGGAVGGDLDLVEERQVDGPGGWLGAVGLMKADLTATYDIAAFDWDNDGDRDLVLGRNGGTYFWLNQTVPDVLFTDTAEISVSAGGSQTFTLDAGPTGAGMVYILLGSIAGTSPALPLAPGVELPLVPDVLFDFALANPNVLPYTDNFGFLDANGEGTASFDLPAGLAGAHVGTVIFHAYAVLDPLTGEVLPASKAKLVSLVP